MSDQDGGQASEQLPATESKAKRGPSAKNKAAWRRYTENGRLKRMNIIMDQDMDKDEIIRQVWSPTQSYSVGGGSFCQEQKKTTFYPMRDV